MDENTNVGIYGKLERMPENQQQNTYYPIALKQKIEKGEAKIVSTVSGKRSPLRTNFVIFPSQFHSLSYYIDCIIVYSVELCRNFYGNFKRTALSVSKDFHRSYKEGLQQSWYHTNDIIPPEAERSGTSDHARICRAIIVKCRQTL